MDEKQSPPTRKALERLIIGPWIAGRRESHCRQERVRQKIESPSSYTKHWRPLSPH